MVYGMVTQEVEVRHGMKEEEEEEETGGEVAAMEAATGREGVEGILMGTMVEEGEMGMGEF